MGEGITPRIRGVSSEPVSRYRRASAPEVSPRLTDPQPCSRPGSHPGSRSGSQPLAKTLLTVPSTNTHSSGYHPSADRLSRGRAPSCQREPKVPPGIKASPRSSRGSTPAVSSSSSPLPPDLATIGTSEAGHDATIVAPLQPPAGPAPTGRRSPVSARLLLSCYGAPVGSTPAPLKQAHSTLPEIKPGA